MLPAQELALVVRDRAGGSVDSALVKQVKQVKQVLAKQVPGRAGRGVLSTQRDAFLSKYFCTSKASKASKASTWSCDAGSLDSSDAFPIVAISCPYLHTSAYVGIRRHTSAYISIRRHTLAYVSILFGMERCFPYRCLFSCPSLYLH